MPRTWFRCLFVLTLIAAIAALYWWIGPSFEPHPGSYDERAKSTDLSRDIELMWETRTLESSGDPTHGPDPRASTDRAINAASRVFNTANLLGKTPDAVIELLGPPGTSSDSTYNFPFFPPQKRSMVYRFDSGMYGWQFDLPLNDDGTVSAVERRWIH